MTHRHQHLVLGLLFIFGAALAAALLLADHGDDRRSAAPTTAPAQQTFRPNTADIVDHLVLSDTADGFRAGTLTRTTLRGDVVELNDTRERSWPKSGEWVSPQVRAEFPFTELVPSWNAITPPQTGVTFDVRVRDAASGEWTDWLYIGSWGRTNTPVTRKIESGAAKVKIDEMVLSRPADGYQVRSRLLSFDFDTSVTPRLRRVAVTYTGRVADPVARARFRHVRPIDRTAWVRDLPVPYRPQGDTPPPLRSQACSPTSVSMVLHYYGIDRPTLENCLAIYDSDYHIFGNWNRAVQRAGELGLDAWLARFRNWDQVKAQIAQGRPIIASIRFEKGTFPSALYADTDGHLIVIRGFNADGDVIVNDPANRAKGKGVVYKANELAHAWFDNGGVGYVIGSGDRGASLAHVERPTTAPTTAQSITLSPSSRPARL